MTAGKTLGSIGVAVAGAAAALATGAPSPGPEPDTPTCVGGEEHQAWVEGDEDAVAAALPDKYEPVRENGKPVLFVRAQRCDALTAAGTTAPVTMANWGIVIESPDGRGCASGAPAAGPMKGDVPPACNWYPLSLIADDQRVVDWLREDTRGVPVELVKGMKFERGEADPATGEVPFHFETQGPSPFTIDDTSVERPGEIALRGVYFFESAAGPVKLLVSTDDLAGGTAESTARAAPGSPLANLMGAAERSSIAPYKDFGLIRAKHVRYRKQLLGPALPGERLHSFEGSCSLEGLVTFTPPATNEQQPDTVYTYDATGTCSGTLDGRELSEAPVKLTQRGESDASCMRAQAFPPGKATMTFDGGTRLPYTVDFTAVATEVDGALYGTRSGIADFHSTFLTPRTSPDTTEKCGGEGLAEAPMDLSFTTASPLVSGQRSRPRAKRLSLAVRPACVPSGQHKRFHFRARAGGKPVRGVRVRFAGRRARTGRRGRAVIAARLGPGAHRAKATKRGLRPATARVRAGRC
jgi:hypothetical protein